MTAVLRAESCLSYDCAAGALVSYLCRVPPLAYALEFGLFVDFLLSRRKQINITIRVYVCAQHLCPTPK